MALGVSWPFMFCFYLLFYPSRLITGYLKLSHRKCSELPRQILFSDTSNPFIHGWSLGCWSLALYTWGIPFHPWTHSSDVICNITFPSLSRTDFLGLYLLKLLNYYSFCPSLSSVKSLRTSIMFYPFLHSMCCTMAHTRCSTNMLELKTTNIPPHILGRYVSPS